MQKYLLAIVTLLAAAPPALAGDWTATRLRGIVMVNDTHGDGEWQRLSRGGVVSDDRVIRTLASGNVEFAQGAETISFGPNSQAQIIDGRRQTFTTVVQQFGKVSVEADARKVQHFSVRTPYLVVVVKGTVFSVTTTNRGSRVAVSRGLVEVTDPRRHRTMMLPAGRELVQMADGQMLLSGIADPALTHPVVNGVVEDTIDSPIAGTVLYDNTTGLGAALGNTMQTVSNTVSGVGSDLGDTISATGDALGDGLGGSLGSALNTTTEGLGTTLDGVGGGLGKAVSGAGGAVGKTLGKTGAGVGRTLSHLGL
ncbi:MAG TPA: FecR domain-containing protein [Devosiaceae bacterium]|nr:FecR domain-containing protein [Devosiaceae bacterium]